MINGEIFITCDANIESGLEEVTLGLNKKFDDFFGDRFYNDSGINITVVLMCRDPRWNFKQRIRFSKKENKLYIDIMLDLPVMARVDMNTRKKIVADKMTREIPQIVAKYKFRDFDLKRFTADLRQWFEDHGWIEPKTDELGLIS